MGTERYAVEPLAEAMRCTVWQVRTRLRVHVHPGQMLAAHTADRLAVKAGLHPALVWPTWVDDGLSPLDELFIREGWRQAWLWRETAA